MHVFKNVTEFFSHCNEVAKSDAYLSNFSLTAEINSITVNANSGHCYFSLKDNSSVVNCCMWRSDFSRLKETFKKGDKVTINGKANFYGPSGNFNIIVSSLKGAGQGDIVARIAQLKNKLAAEGLFDPAHKLAIPQFPKRIGVITSATGAAIHDIIKALNEHNPHYDLLLYPASVQGPNCPSSNIAGIDYFEENNLVDVIIVCRGGGSGEDLIMYNDEGLARRIYDCNIPIISAVGHEFNASICDYVADVHCATPTSIAKTVIVNYDDKMNEIATLENILDFSIKKYINDEKNKVQYLKNHKALYSPKYTLSVRTQALKELKNNLNNTFTNKISNEKNRMLRLIDSLELLGPTNVLKRGFTYTTKAGQTVDSVNNIKPNDEINISFKDGEATATINNIIRRED